jgi:pimeloyl-ACP methyl ester carboxylesterase
VVRRLERNGVALYYEEAGEGVPPVLLVHGWCCDHTYLAPQFEHFARRGHRVVAVDRTNATRCSSSPTI